MARPGLTASHSSMRAVGYRQIWSHLEGKDNLEDAHQKTLAATRQLAKRQLTWLRSERQVRVVDPLETDALATISAHLRGHLER
jgi:tRNA dimethylallyltransferase